MPKLSKSIIWAIILFFDILALISGFFMKENIVIYFVLFVIVNLVFICFQNLDKHGALLGFTISFFTFLVGRQFMDRYGFHSIQTIVSEKINNQAECLILLSIVFLAIGYFFSFRKTEKKAARWGIWFFEDEEKTCIRRVSNLAFLVSFPFLLITLLEIIKYVGRSNYLDYYVSFQSRLPFVIRKIGEMCPVFFFIYLATMPTKKESIKTIALYCIYLALSLLSGRRYECVGGLLILFVYFTMRNKQILGSQSKWFGKKEKVIAILGVISLIFLSTLVGSRRMGTNDEISDSNVLVNFFYQQGISINVIKRTIEHENRLSSGKMYMFGSVISLIKNTLGMENYTGNTIENAINGNSLAHAISYIVLGQEYLSGRGMGSSYIAEVFFSFSYLGVIIANIFYGIVLKKISMLRSNSVWINTVALLMLHSLFFAPRSSFDGFFSDILRINTWSTMLIVFLVSKILIHTNLGSKFNFGKFNTRQSICK